MRLDEILMGMAQAVRATERGAGDDVMEQVVKWGATFRRMALSKWMDQAGTAKRCAARSCKHAGFLECDCCQARVCLGHARIDFTGAAICAGCVEVAAARLRKPDPPNPTVHFRTLGLKSTASWTEVQAAYRKLAARWHPDKKGGSQERFIKIQKAYEGLRAYFTREEAA